MDYKGLRYRRIPVPYHDKVRLLRETRQDYVPFLRDGRRGVPWTKAVDHLERVRPKPSAYPDGSREVSKILEAWEYDFFEDRLWALVAPFLARRFKDPVERWNFTETWEQAYGRFEETRRNPQPVWESLHPYFSLLEACLRRRDYLLVDAPSAFDFAIYGNAFAMEYAGLKLPARYPKLRAWYRRVKRL